MKFCIQLLIVLLLFPSFSFAAPSLPVGPLLLNPTLVLVQDILIWTMTISLVTVFLSVFIALYLSAKFIRKSSFPNRWIFLFVWTNGFLLLLSVVVNLIYRYYDAPFSFQGWQNLLSLMTFCTTLTAGYLSVKFIGTKTLLQKLVTYYTFIQIFLLAIAFTFFIYGFYIIHFYSDRWTKEWDDDIESIIYVGIEEFLLTDWLFDNKQPNPIKIVIPGE